MDWAAVDGFAGWHGVNERYTKHTNGENSTGNRGGKPLVEESGGAETRPRNVAVYYYIKVK